MKYVKLEHRLFVPEDTIAIDFVDYESNDEVFNQRAAALLEEDEKECEDRVNKLTSKLIAIQSDLTNTIRVRDELVRTTPFLRRLLSKEYRNKTNELRTILSEHSHRHELKLRELHEVRQSLEDRVWEHYSTLKHLLNDTGYTLSSASQKGESSITIEVWHKQ